MINVKNLGFLTLFFCLFCSCGGKSEKAMPDQVADAPKEWLTFDGTAANGQHIVFISGDEEYRSEEALPQLAKILSDRYDFKCTVLFAQDPANPGIINPNYTKNIPGLEALETADLMVIFTRFRELPDDQMQLIDQYLRSGKPVVGIRTATHAFNFEKGARSNFIHYSNGYAGDSIAWTDGFGRLVLGEKWISHHGQHKHQSTRGIVAENARNHPIVNGIPEGGIWGSTDVYGVRLPLPGDSEPIVLGQVMNPSEAFDEKDIFYGMKPTDNDVAVSNEEGEPLNDPMMPIAWTKSYQLPGGEEGKVFTSTIGASNDLLIEGTCRLLINGILWALDLPVPEDANFELVGDYHPTSYEFRDDAYWNEKMLKVEDFR